ncbi:MAG: IS1634 family transposase [Candidatus Jettenia caeni]|nr:IS1634 family transposase [Candidatus Jettenia caeni]
MGRICQPTSKRGWYEGWARHTSLSYLIGMSLKKLDSQHFWNQMDTLDQEAIPSIEEEVIKMLIEKQNITLDTLLCDTSNFFTYLDSANEQCRVAQRGYNKQKRMDLKQFGLFLVVSRQDQIPLLHKVYQGNLSDKTIFQEQFKDVVKRLKALCGSVEDMTVVFDQGNNSKKIVQEVNNTVSFIGSVSPYQQRPLLEEANRSMSTITLKGRRVDCYRVRTLLWQMDLTLIVYISEKLRQGQSRGLEQSIKKLFGKLSKLQENIRVPTQRGKKRTPEELEKKITTLIASSVPEGLIGWQIHSRGKGDAFELNYWINHQQLEFLKDQWFGRRILMTNRHQWSTEEIILAYWGQHKVEYIFKNLKNPFHLSLRPQYHWTDHKIEVHGFLCVLAFLLGMVAYKRAQEQAHFRGSVHTLLEHLSSIRLATLIENPSEKTKGTYKATYCLEHMDEDLQALADALGISHKRDKITIPFSVYT